MRTPNTPCMHNMYAIFADQLGWFGRSMLAYMAVTWSVWVAMQAFLVENRVLFGELQQPD